MLLASGYLIADSSGRRTESPEEDHVGILIPRAPERKYIPIFPLDSIAGWPTGVNFPILIDVNPPALHVGDVYIYSVDGKNLWSLQLYGKEHAEGLKKIIGEFAAQKGANLESVLMNEKPKYEIVHK